MLFYKNLLLALILFLGMASCSETTSETQPQTPNDTTQITIATWNVHNLFDTECDSGACETTDYERQYAPDYYKKMIKNIAAGVRIFNSDIVMLQEIEKETSLEDLKAELPQYPYSVFGETGRLAGLDVGLLSKWPIVATKTHREEHPFELDDEMKLIARELIEATIALPTGENIVVFTTHFVSKVTDEEGNRRKNEARIVNEIIAAHEKEAPNAHIAFGGDLNDEPDSEPLTLLKQNNVLYNSTEGMKHEDIATWNNTAAFDHIFHNAALRAKHAKSYRVCSNNIGKLVPSDHCAMVAEYIFNKKEAAESTNNQ
ncbi:MAG: endonuclease/exonuclease/phosphatase family protein [Proteobacteria bacterium]|nr:endonuclease/exonuclease/phosphatase family protein [Pseudomonadota bacterium]